MKDSILGKFHCAGCGYRSDSENDIFNHIKKFHPDLKEAIRNRWRNTFQ